MLYTSAVAFALVSAAEAFTAGALPVQSRTIVRAPAKMQVAEAEVASPVALAKVRACLYGTRLDCLVRQAKPPHVLWLGLVPTCRSHLVGFRLRTRLAASQLIRSPRLRRVIWDCPSVAQRLALSFMDRRCSTTQTIQCGSTVTVSSSPLGTAPCSSIRGCIWPGLICRSTKCQSSVPRIRRPQATLSGREESLSPLV